MSAPVNQPIERADLDRFKAYFNAHHKDWARLHHVLGEGKVKDGHVKQALEMAQSSADEEGEYLAGVLLGMSKSQRISLSKKIT